ncbi:MAG: protease PrsW [Chthoniobacter sp.]|nr:protease PrsW [Chthoniobacter sp.]
MQTFANLEEIEPPQAGTSAWAELMAWSHHPYALAGFAGAVVALAMLAAWFVRGDETSRPKPVHRDLAGELKKPRPDLEKVLLALPETWEIDDQPVTTALEKSQLDHAGKMVAAAYWDSLHPSSGEANAELIYYAHYIHPVRFANELVGDFHAKANHLDKAAEYYGREVKFFNAQTARAKLIPILLAKHDVEAARKLAGDDAITMNLSVQEKLTVAAKTHRWGDLVKPIIEMEKSLLRPIPLVLAIVAGLTWLAVSLHAIQPPGVFCFRVIVPLLAVLAGMVSTSPTLFAVAWQEEMWGMAATGDFLKDLPMYLFGVGPREELIKLLFFLPFVPALLIRKSRLEMLIVAGCVGLGFAVSENLLYFAQLGPAAAFGRCLLANFLHLSMTGLIGFALCEWLMAPVRKLLPFLGTFVAVALAHGLFDALLPIVIKGISPSMIIFSVLALFFFRLLAANRAKIADTFSMAGTLVIGISALAATIIVTASMTLGFRTMLGVLIVNAIVMSMVVVMFYFQLTEGMQDAEGECKPSYI